MLPVITCFIIWGFKNYTHWKKLRLAKYIKVFARVFCVAVINFRSLFIDMSPPYGYCVIL